MKIRFYCDVPKYWSGDLYPVYAMSRPMSNKVTDGFVRVAFDVDFPPDVLVEYDVKAPAEVKGVV